MKRILMIFGTRPEAIKMCPVFLELQRREAFDVKVCVTGQHREMLDSVLKVFGVTPDYDLNVMKKNQNLFDITIEILSKLESVIDSCNPQLIMVHGDTTSSFVSALAAFYKKIPVAHIEAGLRTNNIYEPFPEEFNRQAVSLITRYHFAPTAYSKANLLNEGKNKENIFITGNTVIDALRYTVTESFSHPELEWVGESKMILFTMHRRENWGQSMKDVFNAIRNIARLYADVKIIYPIHMNPQIRELADSILANECNIHIIEPLDVIEFHNFIKRSYFIVTDSGGIQEEATAFGKPVLVLRNKTERPEGIETGALQLIGTEYETVFNCIETLLCDKGLYQNMSNAKNPYGDGFASVHIADILESVE